MSPANLKLPQKLPHLVYLTAHTHEHVQTPHKHVQKPSTHEHVQKLYTHAYVQTPHAHIQQYTKPVGTFL